MGGLRGKSLELGHTDGENWRTVGRGARKASGWSGEALRWRPRSDHQEEQQPGPTSHGPCIIAVTATLLASAAGGNRRRLCFPSLRGLCRQQQRCCWGRHRLAEDAGARGAKGAAGRRGRTIQAARIHGWTDHPNPSQALRSALPHAHITVNPDAVPTSSALCPPATESCSDGMVVDPPLIDPLPPRCGSSHTRVVAARGAKQTGR